MNYLYDFLVNNPQASMSIYRNPNLNKTEFVFTEIDSFEGICLNWVYNKFLICYKNDVFDIKIRSTNNHLLHNTLNFGKVIFDNLIHNVIQLKKMKRRKISFINLIKKYFADYNEINVYRPSVAELVLKINTLNEKREANKTCCVCLANKYINDESIFNCSHVELCWTCFFKLPTNNTRCPICRKGLC
jgi:hypothetical protein